MGIRGFGIALMLLVLTMSEGLAGDGEVEKNDTIPTLTMPNLKGNPRALRKPDNRLTLIYFWASWCKPCREDLPAYMELYRRYKNASFEEGTEGFTLYAISLDKRRKAWHHAAKQHQIPAKLTVSDLRGWSSKAVEQFSIEAIPASFMVNGEGVVKAVNVRDSLGRFLENQKR